MICNALDDATRSARGIETDSPAASRKVLLMCRAVRLAGVRPIILSLGRGRQDGSGRFFGAAVRRVGGVPIIYAPLWHLPLLSQITSLLAPAALLFRMRHLAGNKVVMFYNRTPAYLPTLWVAVLLRLRTVLDLEDGEVLRQSRNLSDAAARHAQWAFDRLCTGGALLACRPLEKMTSLRPLACYYGTVEADLPVTDWPATQLNLLMGGTVSRDTGAQMLVDAIEILREQQPQWASELTIEITGKGDSIEALRKISDQSRWPRVVVHGRTTDSQYRTIVGRAHVGLALKPRLGALSNTTFPSKVIELAGAGLLVLSTDISDVRLIMDRGALYLEDETPTGLVNCLRWIAENRKEAQVTAALGSQRVLDRCTPLRAGLSLVRFLFDGKP